MRTTRQLGDDANEEKPSKDDNDLFAEFNKVGPMFRKLLKIMNGFLLTSSHFRLNIRIVKALGYMVLKPGSIFNSLTQNLALSEIKAIR